MHTHVQIWLHSHREVLAEAARVQAVCIQTSVYSKALGVRLHAWTWAVPIHAGMEARRPYQPRAGTQTPVNTSLAISQTL